MSVYYVDQSGKVEYTSHITAVAYSNGKHKSIFISSVEKRKIQKIFRDIGKPDMFVYITFSSLIYLLIKDELEDFDKNKIVFKLVGKQSECHKLAISVLRKRIKPDKIIAANDILKLVL